MTSKFTKKQLEKLERQFYTCDETIRLYKVVWSHRKDQYSEYESMQRAVSSQYFDSLETLKTGYRLIEKDAIRTVIKGVYFFRLTGAICKTKKHPFTPEEQIVIQELKQASDVPVVGTWLEKRDEFNYHARFDENNKLIATNPSETIVENCDEEDDGVYYRNSDDPLCCCDDSPFGTITCMYHRELNYDSDY